MQSIPARSWPGPNGKPGGNPCWTDSFREVNTAAVMGALVDQTQLNTVLRYIESGRAEGAKLLTGGEQARRAGTVHVNQYDEDDVTVPFGGYKQSGIGRDKSLHAFDKYTETKTTWIRIDSPV